MSLNEWYRHQFETPPDPADPKPFSIKSWRKGNKVIFTPPPMMGGVVIPPEGKRGNISKLTPATMRRLKRDLGEVVADTEAYTFCLTYPDLFPSAKVARAHFNKLTRWCSRKRWRAFGAHYKREPQKRGATHFHILIYCNEGEEVARKCADAWLRKWCAISSEGQSDEEKAKQLEWHLHENNFERMRGDSFFDYLGKYISKDGGNMPEGYVNEGGGKWWGKINRASIPYAVEVDQTPEVALTMQRRIMRVIYKLREKRMQGALDALHPAAENPRLQRDQLAKAIYQMHKASGMRPISARKMATRLVFRLDGCRKLPNAPIKVGQSSRFDCKQKITRLPRHGKITLLGRPVPITDAIERMVSGAADHAARKRIFSDDYHPPYEIGSNESIIIAQ
ncbi:hypothetical protein JIN77_03135 [Verrucomicrobiaceae bacterium R5-34]|nr:hypothetical protein [Verrucomicrobiaceae bacterium R5-34]